MLLLLDGLLSAVLEDPLDYLGLRTGTLDFLSKLECSPEVVEGRKLDQVPDLREVGWDERALDNVGGCGDHGGHLGSVV